MQEVIPTRKASHTVSALGYTQKKCQTSVHDLELQKKSQRKGSLPGTLTHSFF